VRKRLYTNHTKFRAHLLKSEEEDDFGAKVWFSRPHH